MHHRRLSLTSRLPLPQFSLLLPLPPPLPAPAAASTASSAAATTLQAAGPKTPKASPAPAPASSDLDSQLKRLQVCVCVKCDTCVQLSFTCAPASALRNHFTLWLQAELRAKQEEDEREKQAALADMKKLTDKLFLEGYAR